MTPAETGSMLASLAARLDDEIALLQALRGLSEQQHAAMAANAMADLGATVAARDRVMSALLAVAESISPLRALVRQHEQVARTLPGFAPADSRRRLAHALIREILQRDRETLEAVRAANLSRDEQARALEAGNATLAAYRRSLDTPSSTAVVVSQRA